MIPLFELPLSRSLTRALSCACCCAGVLLRGERFQLFDFSLGDARRCLVDAPGFRVMQRVRSDSEVRVCCSEYRSE